MITQELDIGAASRIAVPSGRDYDRCLEAFEETYGVTAPRFDDRRLRLEMDSREYTRVKGKDVPAIVAEGYADIGLTGTDVCEEQIPENPNDSNLLYRAIGDPMCSFNLLLPNETAETLSTRLSDPEAEPVLVATSYPNFLGRSIKRAREAGLPMNITVSPFRPAGSAEIMPALGVSEAVADLVESGDTAVVNGLTIGPKLADVSPAIVWRDPNKAQAPLDRLRFGVDQALTERAAQLGDPDLTSYTLERLRNPNLAIKDFGEEQAEFLEAVISGKPTAADELADLLFAGLVLSKANGGDVKLAQVIHILEKRNIASSLKRREIS
jgi:ATP phosphoribosyltransferase